MKMEEYRPIWFLWLYCLGFTSAYWTPSYTTPGSQPQVIERFVCGNGSHIFTSPGYPSGYGNNIHIEWIFSTHPGNLLYIQFNDFDLEDFTDYVFISSDGEKIGGYTGSQLPPTTVSTTNNTLTVVFKSDHSVSGRGFQAEISVYSESESSDGMICSDFNDGWCGWFHYSSSSRWRRSSERISGAGRDNRYSSSSDDYYICVESSYSSYYGYLESPVIPATWNEVCLKFYYYMSGNSYQYLQIYHRHDYYYDSSLFYTYDDYSGRWKYASVNFNNSDYSTLRIKARAYTYSSSYPEMVAVDDIYISEGRCSNDQEIIPTSPKTDIESKTDVVCSGSYMTVYLDASINFTGNVHFLDATCTAAGYVYRNGIRWIYLYTRFDECRTSMTSTLISTTYHNQVIASEDGVISREDDFRISVECELDNRGRSSVSFNAETEEQNFLKKQNGNFTFTMELYTSDDYSTPYSYSDYPVELRIGSKVYVGASVQTFSNELVLFVDSCKATPNPDPDANPQHQIIENSCGVDSTVEFYGQTSKDTARVFFSFETFRFNGDYSTVFVHCQLSICNESNSRCHRDCRQRQRRDVSTPDKLSDTIPIVLGPVILKRSDGHTSVILETEESTSKKIFPALSSTLLFAVSLVVLVVGCVYWLRGWVNTKNMYQQLENNMQDM